MRKATANLYKVEVGNETHSILETFQCITDDRVSEHQESTFNFVLVDVSASMRVYSKPLVNYWNELISPLLTKEMTECFHFGSEIQFKNNDSLLNVDDFISGSTNLTSAICLINTKVKSLENKFIRIFLLTDGLHSAGDVKPDIEIAKLLIPADKTIEVFLLGFGARFPEEFAINLRSALHNGASSIPFVFWAKCLNSYDKYSDILEEIENIADNINNGIFKIKIDPQGKLAPDFPDIDECYLGEFIYFAASPDSLMLSLSTLDDFPLELKLNVKEVDKSFPIHSLLRQWNSLILQYICQKRKLPAFVLDVMQSIYKYYSHKLLSHGETQTISYRLIVIENKRLESKYDKLIEYLKKIIDAGDYPPRNELLDCISNKISKLQFDDENGDIEKQKLKDYIKSVKEFTVILREIKPNLKVFDSSSDECKITKTSMIKDILNPSLSELLLEDKLTFMTNFTVTGMPVLISFKNSPHISPWMLCVNQNSSGSSIVVSQNTLEYSAECNSSSFNTKTVHLEEGYEIRYNAVVPILSPKYANVMKSLVRTKIFAMLCSFCIYGNPYITDYNAHFAVLGCTWIKLLAKKHNGECSDNISQELESIYATATLYLDREDLTQFFQSLISNPKEILLRENKKKGSNKENEIRCESIIKPLFLLFLNQDKLNENICEDLVPLILLELIGRCLAKYKNKNYKNCLCSLFLQPDLSNDKKREEFIDSKSKELSKKILESFVKTRGKLLNVFYKPEDLQKTLKEFTKEEMKSSEDEDVFSIKINNSYFHCCYKWREEYSAVHSREIVQPMTKELVLLTAQKKGVEVNQENFEAVYRFDSQSGLLRNSCMVKNCPFYLIPNESFGQHIFAGREKIFIHQFHKISLEVALENGSVDDVISRLFPQNSNNQISRENSPYFRSQTHFKKLRREIFRL
ncbi:Sodium-coupled monocarboxylate transporter 1, partial [Armadillidium vulgare]